MLYEAIAKVIERRICDSEQTYARFAERLEEGLLTRDENPQSHFCAYFLPYNRDNQKFFLGHHKKANMWIAPGGHIDKGETLLDTVNRELEEELGVRAFFQEAPKPFLLTITPIENKIQICKAHFDIWFLVPTDGANFLVDPREFHETKWVGEQEAKQLAGDAANQKAIEIVKQIGI